MKKLFLWSALFFYLHTSLLAQTLPLPAPALPYGWIRIEMSGIGSFDIPPTMEVQAGKYKEFKKTHLDEVSKNMGLTFRVDLSTQRLVVQQSGLNDFSGSSFGNYARVIVEEQIGRTGDYEKINFNLSNYAPADIAELNRQAQAGMRQGFAGTKIKLLTWFPLKIEKLNGMSCIHLSYKRQLGDNPPVLVHIYRIPNNDREYIFTLSYSDKVASYRKADFEKIKSSIRINDIR